LIPQTCSIARPADICGSTECSAKSDMLEILENACAWNGQAHHDDQMLRVDCRTGSVCFGCFQGAPTRYGWVRVSHQPMTENTVENAKRRSRVGEAIANVQSTGHGAIVFRAVPCVGDRASGGRWRSQPPCERTKMRYSTARHWCRLLHGDLDYALTRFRAGRVTCGF